MKTSYQLSVPKPCHENWDQMSPDQKGKFCNACATTVVDFTGMPSDAIKKYLVQHAGQKICGKFNPSSLDAINVSISEEVIAQKYSFRRAFLLALFITMGTTLVNCTNIEGKKQKIESVEVVTKDTLPKKLKDTIDIGAQTILDTIQKTIDTTKKSIPPPPPIKKIELPIISPIGEPAIQEADIYSEKEAPYISESDFANELTKLSNKEIHRIDFKAYFCGNLHTPMLANKEKTTFMDFLRKITKQKISIQNISIEREKNNCISFMNITYKRTGIF